MLVKEDGGKYRRATAIEWNIRVRGNDASPERTPG